MVLGGTGSVGAGTDWYLVVLCQYGAVLVLCGTGSVSSGTGLVKGSYACIYRKKWRFGRMSPCGTDEQKGKIELLSH